MLTLRDGMLMCLYFAAVIAVGLRAGRRERTMAGFALGDRNIPWWAVVASILAAEVSAATFLGAPVEGYAKRNFAYAQFGLGMVLGRIVVGYLFLPTYFAHGVVSIYEFLAVRFGTTTKNAASAIFLLTRALASGARLYAAAILFVVAWTITTGSRPTPSEELALYAVVLVGIAAVTTVYTALGGIKAVVWTDTIQTAVMYGGLVIALVYLLRGIAVLLVVVGAVTAWAAIVLRSRIIPIVLGVFGYTYGSLLGVFLVGALTRTRGSDRGNLLAMAAGFVAVVALGELPHRLDPTLPKLAFPWFILLGTVATVLVALAFATPAKQQELAKRHRAERARL